MLVLRFLKFVYFLCFLADFKFSLEKKKQDLEGLLLDHTKMGFNTHKSDLAPNKRPFIDNSRELLIKYTLSLEYQIYIRICCFFFQFFV